MFENLSSFLFLKELLLNNHVEQFSSRAELSDQVDVFLILEILVKLENVGVIEVSQDLDLVREPLWVANLLFVDGLASSDLTSLLVQNSLDCPKGACAEDVLFVDLVEGADRVFVFGDHARLLDQELFEHFFQAVVFHMIS